VQLFGQVKERKGKENKGKACIEGIQLRSFRKKQSNFKVNFGALTDRPVDTLSLFFSLSFVIFWSSPKVQAGPR